MADAMASGDEGLGKKDTALAIADPQDRPVLQAQVVLDCVGFGPMVVDREMGLITQNALRGFQEVNKLAVTCDLDPATIKLLAKGDTIPATRPVRTTSLAGLFMCPMSGLTGSRRTL